MKATAATVLPALGEEGILPPGIFTCRPQTVFDYFVAPFPLASNRLAIYKEWRSHRAALYCLGPVLYQWIDGSFVTSKPCPSDIDVVTFIDGPAYDRLPRWKRDVIDELNNGRGDASYGHVDSKIVTVFPKGDARHGLYRDTRLYWDEKWSSYKPGNRKGYLEVR
jgi:hypothetical protein